MSDQSGGPTASDVAELSSAVAEKRGWFIALGILLIILGVVCIGSPLVTTIAVKVFIGWLFLIGGIAQVVHAFSASDWSGFLWDLLIGILYVFVGGWLAFFPLTGIITLTILIAAMFVAEGLIKFVMGLNLRPAQGWVWMIISGLAAFVLGLMLFFGLPGTAAWAIGLMVGINLLLSGWAFLMMSLFAEKTA